MSRSVNGRGNPLVRSSKRGTTRQNFNKTRIRKVGKLSGSVRRVSQQFPAS